MFHRPYSVVAMLLAFCWAAVAQMHPGAPGNSINSGSLSGVVRTSTDKPAPNVRIEVRSLSNGSVVASAYTAANGSFDIINLPIGAYEVHAMSGLNDTMDRVDMRGGGSYLSLRLPQSDSDDDGSSMVTVAQLRAPGKARDAFHKAQRAMDKQKYAQAEKDVDKALQIFPAYADALTLRALLRMDGDRLPEAIEDLQNAIHDDPNYSLAYIVMGAAFNQTSRFDDAIRVLQRGMALNPASWQAYFEMGKSFVGKGDFAAGIRNLDRAEQMAPQNYAPLHLVKAHALLGMKSYTDAIAELEIYLQKDPNGQASPQARETLAKVKAFMATKK